MGFGAAAALGFRRTFDTLRDVLARKNLRRFLLAFFVYEDGVNTVIFFAWVYAADVLRFEPAELLGLIAAVNVTAVIGSQLIAKPTDVKGPRWAVGVLLGWWVLVVLGVYLSTTKGMFVAVALLAGLGIGGIQSASRAFMSRLVPPGREAELFGFYALCGKTGAIIGPALFGTVAASLGLRNAALTVIPFYAVGYLLLRRVRAEVDPL
jgi:UMF1 family MFS transporter